MPLKPFNRHVVLSPVEREVQEKKSTILVPDDYIQNKVPYEVYKVIDVARDCEKITDTHVNRHVVVNNNMIEEIKVHGITYYLLLENYIYGALY
jgi:hypothetical protein